MKHTKQTYDRVPAESGGERVLNICWTAALFFVFLFFCSCGLNQQMNESHLHRTTWLAQMWQAYFSRWKIAWQSSCLYIFTLDSPCRPPLLSPPHPSPPLPTIALSVGASPSRALHPRLCANCYLAVEHYLEFTRIWRGHGRGNFSALWGCSQCSGRRRRRWGGDFWLGYRLALRGSAWQIIDLSGRRWQQCHVCECSDCYWLTTWVGDLSGGKGWWSLAVRAVERGIWGFYSSFFPRPSFLSLSVSSWQSWVVLWIPDWRRKNDFI